MIHDEDEERSCSHKNNISHLPLDTQLQAQHALPRQQHYNSENPPTNSKQERLKK